MTSDISLELDHDSVRLLRRGSEGEVELGRVPLDQPDTGARLAAIRDQAGGSPLEAAIVLPSSLVLFLDVGDGDDAEVETLLAAKTPCPTDELVIGRAGTMAAAVERATLDEARGFATQHGLQPTAFFVRRPDGGGEVSFPLDPPPLTFRSSRAALPEEAPQQAEATVSSSRPRTTPRAAEIAPATAAQAQAAPAKGAAPRRPTEPPAGSRAAAPAPVTSPVSAARSEAEALTVFGARDREPRRRSSTPLHVAAAVLALAVVLTAFQLFKDAPEDIELVGMGGVVEASLDPIQEDQPDAEVIATAIQNPGAAPAEPTEAAEIDGDAVVADTPGSAPSPAASLPAGTTLADDPAMASLSQPRRPELDLPGPFTRPPPPGTVFDMDERGLVRPSEDGAPTPKGVLVYSGPPAVVPPTPPGEEEPDPQVAGTEDDASLPMSQAESSQPEIVRLRPPARPDTEEPAIVVVAETAAENTPRPLGRPAAIEQVAVTSSGPADAPDFDALARQARTETAAAVLTATRAAEPPPEAPEGQANVAVQPNLPTRASVAERATMSNAIRLERVNLIGVYGSPSDRRALIRLPTGRYVKVQVGDRIDGGRIAAIEASGLEYVKGGQRYALTMPNG